MNKVSYLEKELKEVENSIETLKRKITKLKWSYLPAIVLLSILAILTYWQSFYILSLFTFGITVSLELYKQGKIKHYQKELDGEYYAKIGLKKEMREVEQEKINVKTKQHFNPLEIEEKKNLYQECGSHIKLLNQKKYLEYLKEKYFSIEPTEIEKCVYQLTRKK